MTILNQPGQKTRNSDRNEEFWLENLVATTSYTVACRACIMIRNKNGEGGRQCSGLVFRQKVSVSFESTETDSSRLALALPSLNIPKTSLEFDPYLKDLKSRVSTSINTVIIALLTTQCCMCFKSFIPSVSVYFFGPASPHPSSFSVLITYNLFPFYTTICRASKPNP